MSTLQKACSSPFSFEEPKYKPPISVFAAVIPTGSFPVLSCAAHDETAIKCSRIPSHSRGQRVIVIIFLTPNPTHTARGNSERNSSPSSVPKAEMEMHLAKVELACKGRMQGGQSFSLAIVPTAEIQPFSHAAGWGDGLPSGWRLGNFRCRFSEKMVARVPVGGRGSVVKCEVAIGCVRGKSRSY